MVSLHEKSYTNIIQKHYNSSSQSTHRAYRRAAIPRRHAYYDIGQYTTPVYTVHHAIISN